MKRIILTVIGLAALSITVIGAQELQTIPVAPTPAMGAPGTATPTPYPQITPTSVPKVGSGSGGAQWLPPIEVPAPPKDQTLPGLAPHAPKTRAPDA